MTLTWREARDQLIVDLARAGLESPEVDARRLVEAASGHDASSFHDIVDQAVGRRALAVLDRLAARRRSGEPLQYVVGSWGFRTLDLFVDQRVLIPRPETEVVTGVAIDEIDRAGRPEPTVVDLGTGSGAIALAVAVERPRTRVWATDRSADALDVARANLAGTGRAAARVTLAQGSWFDALPAQLEGSVDLVVSNPPYVSTDEDLPAVVAAWEPTEALIAGPDGLEAVETILTGAARWLAPGGAVVVEVAPHQAHRTHDVATAAGLREVSVHTDLNGRERAVVAHRPT